MELTLKQVMTVWAYVNFRNRTLKNLIQLTKTGFRTYNRRKNKHQLMPRID